MAASLSSFSVMVMTAHGAVAAPNRVLLTSALGYSMTSGLAFLVTNQNPSSLLRSRLEEAHPREAFGYDSCWSLTAIAYLLGCL